MAGKEKRLPLEGVRVLSFTQSWTGPFASMLLGDLGAEVLRLEQIQYPGVTRGVAYPDREIWVNDRTGGIQQYVDREPEGPNGEYPWNRYSFGNCHLQNTYGFTLDISRPKGWTLFRRLVQLSDIFIENNTPLTLPKLGITWEFLHGENPDLIVIRAPAFGLDGPYFHWKGFGSNIEAAIGHTWLMRYSDDPEHTLSNRHTFVMDNCGSHTVPATAMMALLQRERTGEGMLIEIPQAEGVMAALPEPWMEYSANQKTEFSAQGNRLPTAIQGCYPARENETWKDVDQWIVITINDDREWRGFCEALGNPEWTKNPGFAGVTSRRQNQDELDVYIAEWTKQHDNYAAMAILQEHGVPAGAVQTEAMNFADPHVNSRDFWIKETQKWSGTHLYTGYTGKYLRTPRKNRAEMPACGLGEHNEYVFKGILGLSEDEYAGLEREEYIGTAWLT